ncbi:MAG: LTA synthase family protein [Halopseudomonas sp.]
MADTSTFVSVGLPLLLGLIASIAAEQGLTPQPQKLWLRSLKSTCLHVGSWLLLFCLLLALTQRPWFTMAAVLGLQIFLVVVNNVKFDSLKEPFLFQDFEYFWDMIKHPRLYIPFFGFWRTLLSSLGAIAVITLGLTLEPSLIQSISLGLFWSLNGTLLLIATVLLLFGLTIPSLDHFDPDHDFDQLGQVAFFWLYGRALMRSPSIDSQASPFLSPASPNNAETLPHLIAVQSESFFDPRRLSPLIKDELLENYDRVVSQSLSHGRLEVPAWGANTVRTECSFLTGLAPAALGIHAFNPYRYLAKNNVPNLASHMREKGYRTICIHPYLANFYLRDKVFPKLGFDQFIDIKDFSEDQKEGQYTGDAAVADKISELIETASRQPESKPLFIFVITMENHGPLHLEKPDPATVEQFCQQPLPPGCDDLAVYLGHIRNADRMIDQLTSVLSQASREGVLCWYGDHLPIMPTVYRSMAEVDGRTEYLIWRSDSSSTTTQQQDLSVEQLAAQLGR